MIKKVYGIDLDGVCFDFLNAFRCWLNDALHIDIKEHEVTDYYWYKSSKDINEKQFWKEFDKFGIGGHGYRHLKLLEGAVEGLSAIDAAGHDIFYITNRPPYAIEDTKISIAKAGFPQQHNLHFAKGDKAPLIKKFNIDVFIDDSPTTVARLAANTRAQIYCRNYKFNEHLDDNDGKWFRRVNNWSEFLIQEGIRGW